MTIQKLKTEYTPLGMAVFLAIGGLVSGMIWSSIFASRPAGTVVVERSSGSPGLIAAAEGAEIDSAALTPQSAPFLASMDGVGTTRMPENSDALYRRGALEDPDPVLKTKTNAPTSSADTIAAGVAYTIASGDTLTSIAQEFNVPPNTIIEFNPSVNFGALVAGVSIVIPNQKNATSFSG